MDNRDLRIGKKAVELGLITAEQLQGCLQFQQQCRQRSMTLSLTECMVHLKYLDQGHVARIERDLPKEADVFDKDAPTLPLVDATEKTGPAPEVATPRQGSEPAKKRDGGSRRARVPVVDNTLRRVSGPIAPGDTALESGVMFRHYQIQEVLGRGRAGTVYRARDTKLRRTVALRLLPAACQRKEFMEEIAAIAQLEHFNIVRLFEVDSTPSHYLAMEYVEGTTLASLIRQCKVCSGELPDLLGKVAEALHEAHRRKIVHGAIRPSNILVIADNNPKIMDFGVHHADFDTKDPQNAAILSYLSPQQARGEKADKNSDIYSLGATMYECLTGRPPFYGDSRDSILAQIEKRAPLSPADLNPDVGQGLGSICLKALEKSVDDRYLSVKQMQKDLLAIGQTRIVSARGSSSSRSGVLWQIRQWHTAAIIVMAIALICAAAIALGLGLRSAGLGRENTAAAAKLAEMESRLERARQTGENRLAGACEILSALHNYVEKMSLSPDDWQGLSTLISELERTGTWDEMTSLRGRFLKLHILVYGQSRDPKYLPKALAAFERLLKDEPNDVLLYVERGRLYYRHRKYREAGEDLNRALAINPASWQAHESLGELRYLEQNYQDAETECNQAIHLNPQTARSYNNRALVYFSQGLYQKAQEDLDRAIALNSKFAEAYRNRGMLHVVLQRYLEAERDYNTAVQIDPYSPESLNCRGELYFLLGLFPEAQKDYDCAIKLDPACAIAYLNRGDLYRTRKMYAEAERDYQDALRIKPDYSDAYAGRGQMYSTIGRLVEARRDFEEALRLDPQNANAYNNRGVLHYNQRDYEAAERDYNLAIQYNGRSVTAYFNRGLLFMAQKRDADAVRDFSYALRLSPTNPSLYLWRGSAYFEMQLYQNAIADWETAINYNSPQKAQLEDMIKRTRALMKN